MDRLPLSAVFHQILEGYEFSKPDAILRLKVEDAEWRGDRVPYSMLTNLAHAVMWQRFWLQALAGGRAKSGMEEWKNDWRLPSPDEWPVLRAEFVAGLTEAARIAGSEPFDHQMESDEKAVETLVRIAVHGSYHLGQLALLKRIRTASRRHG